MKKEEMNTRLDEFLREEKDVEEVTIPSQLEGTRTVFDGGDILCKEVTFTPEENMSEEWFWKKTHVQTMPKSNPYEIDFKRICDFVFSHCPKEMFTTLEALFFVFNEDGLRELAEYTGDEYGLECINMDEQIGLMWYEKNIVIVNVGLIQQTSEEMADEITPASEHICDGIIMTIVHGMRHLMLRTNFLLTDEERPVEEESEDAVEEYARRFADQWLQYTPDFVTRKQEGNV